MKLKPRYWTGLAVVTYCVLAYIFMWPPMVNHTHRADSSAWTCVVRLCLIDAAIKQFSIEHNKHIGDPVSAADITPYLPPKEARSILSCPDGGTYTFHTIGVAPTCSLGKASKEPERIRVQYFYWEQNPKYYLHHVLK